MFHRHKHLLLFLATIFFILSLLTPALNFFQEKQAQKTLGKEAQILQAELNNRLDYLSKAAEEIANSGEATPYIKNEDILELTAILDQLKQKYDAGLIMAVNKEGVALSRTGASTKRGDYVLHNMAWGQDLLQKRPIKIIDKGTYYPLLLLAGVPIIENDQFIGAIVVAKNIDDDFSLEIKEKFLKLGTHLAFYSNTEGVIGSSFAEFMQEQNTDTAFFASYFNTYSNIITNRPDEQQYAFFNVYDHNFLIKKIEFAGKNMSPGGILLFGYNDSFLFSALAGLIFATTIVLMVILYFCLTGKCLITQGRFTKKNALALGFLGLAIAIILFLATNALLNKKYEKITKPAYLLYNSILKITPEQGTLDKNFRHRFAVQVEPGGEAINAVSATINFDPKIIEVTDILTTASFCDPRTFLEKTIDNTLGQVKIACGLLGEELLGRTATVAEILVSPLQTSSFELTFGEDSSVFAKDGLATDVLRLTIGGHYQIKDHTYLDPASRALLVFSSSHPNSARWYNTRQLNFSWSTTDPEAQYSYLLNQAADSIPATEYITVKNNVSLTANQDGVWYFHVKQIKNGKAGPVSHFKIKIDTTPPQFKEAFASATTIKSGEIVRLMFDSKDELSGGQSHYTQIDNGIFLPVVSPLYIPFTAKGRHRVTIRSYDQANNFSEHTLIITVTGPSFWQDRLHINLK